MNYDYSSDPVLAKFGVIDLVVDGNEKNVFEFIRSARKLIEANCLDLKNIGQLETLGLAIIQICFHGRNAVLERVLDVSNEEEHKEINSIIITVIGLGYTVGKHRTLEDSLGAKICDIADLIDEHNEYDKATFRSKVYSLVSEETLVMSIDEQINVCKKNH